MKESTAGLECRYGKNFYSTARSTRISNHCTRCCKSEMIIVRILVVKPTLHYYVMDTVYSICTVDVCTRCCIFGLFPGMWMTKSSTRSTSPHRLLPYRPEAPIPQVSKITSVSFFIHFSICSLRCGFVFYKNTDPDPGS